MTTATFSLECVGLHVLQNRYKEIIFSSVFFWFFFKEDLDLETSGLVVLDYLFLQQNGVSTVLFRCMVFL